MFNGKQEKKMKQTLKKTMTVLTLIGSMSTFAATTGDITISGTVAPELELSLSATTYTTLPIVAGGSATVATANEVCNNLDGYKIYGHALNGALENQSNTAVSTTYDIDYGSSTGVTLGVGSANKVELKDSGVLTASADVDEDIVVNVDAFATAPAGTYQDTITLEIVAN